MEKIFDFKNKEFGLVCSGEMIMRLSPLNNEMLIQGHLLEKQMGGAEFNVASGVSILGEKTAIVTKLPENELGKFAKKIISSNVVIGITTGGAIGMSSEERLAAVPFCKAELASCNAGSVNFCFSPIADKIKIPKYDWEIPFVKNTYDLPFVNTFQGIEDYIKVMGENGTKPEFEVYEVGMINNIAYFMKKGLLKGPIYLQFVLGIMGGLPATVDNLLFLYNTAKKQLGDNFVWSCAAAGKDQFNIVTTAVILHP